MKHTRFLMSLVFLFVVVSTVRPDSEMSLHLWRNGTVYIIDVEGEIVSFQSYKLKALFGAMVEKGVRAFVLNLAEATFIDKEGIDVLFWIRSETGRLNLKLAITNLSHSVKKVFEIGGLTGAFPITTTIDEALQLVSAQGS